MKQQEKEIIEQLTIEETGDQDSYQLADLGLSDQQLAEIKGGPGGGWGCQTCDYQNHNETMTEDEEIGEATELTDLAMRAEQSGKVQGGISRTGNDNNHGTHVAGTIGSTGNGGGWGCPTCDYSNHNETTVSDKDDEANLADLSLTDEELDGIKGGKTVKLPFIKRGSTP